MFQCGCFYNIVIPDKLKKNNIKHLHWSSSECRKIAWCQTTIVSGDLNAYKKGTNG